MGRKPKGKKLKYNSLWQRAYRARKKAAVKECLRTKRESSGDDA